MAFPAMVSERHTRCYQAGRACQTRCRQDPGL
jgi:hypothetical protein